MGSSDTDSRVRQTLPPDAIPCVWMTAGLVAYKLCDRELRCEDCAFDAAMVGGERGVATAPAAEAPAPPSLVFPEDRLYDRSHTWAGVLEKGRVRVGLDAFAARMLRSLTGVILPAPGAVLTRGHVGCWIADEAATVSVSSPVSGPVLRVNTRLRTRPALAADDPYGAGWLVEVGCDDPGTALEDLLSPAAIRERTLEDLQAVREAATETPHAGREEVGATLADGGEAAADLRRALGPKRYYGLIARLLA